MNLQSTRNFSDNAHGPVDIHKYLTVSNQLYVKVPAGYLINTSPFYFCSLRA